MKKMHSSLDYMVTRDHLPQSAAAGKELCAVKPPCQLSV